MKPNAASLSCVIVFALTVTHITICASKPAEHHGSLSQERRAPYTIDELEQRFRDLPAQSNVSSFERLGLWLESLETTAKDLHDQTLSSRCAQLRKQISERSKALNPSSSFPANRVRAKTKKPKKRRKTIVVDSQQDQVFGPSDTTRIATQVLGGKDNKDTLPNASVLDETGPTTSSNSATTTKAEQTPGTISTILARALPFLRRNKLEKLEGLVNENLNLDPSKLRSDNLQENLVEVNKALESERKTLLDAKSGTLGLDPASVQEKITRYEQLQAKLIEETNKPVQHNLRPVVIPEISQKFDHKAFTNIETATPPNSPTEKSHQVLPITEGTAHSANGLKRMGAFRRLCAWIKDHKIPVSLILLATGGTILKFQQPLAKRLVSTRVQVFKLFKRLTSLIYARRTWPIKV